MGKRVSIKIDKGERYNIMLDISMVKYAVTEIGGGWAYSHNLFVITADDRVLYASKFDEENPLCCEVEKEFGLYDFDKSPCETVISTTSYTDENGEHQTSYKYLDSLMKNGKVDFEDVRDLSRFVCDSPKYTLYKNKNNCLEVIADTYNLDSLPAVEYLLYIRYKQQCKESGR